MGRHAYSLSGKFPASPTAKPACLFPARGRKRLCRFSRDPVRAKSAIGSHYGLLQKSQKKSCDAKPSTRPLHVLTVIFLAMVLQF